MVFWNYIMVTGQSRSVEKKEKIYPIYVVFGQDVYSFVYRGIFFYADYIFRHNVFCYEHFY